MIITFAKLGNDIISGDKGAKELGLPRRGREDYFCNRDQQVIAKTPYKQYQIYLKRKKT